MSKFKKLSSGLRISPKSVKKKHSMYMLTSNARLPEGYSIRNNFLMKNSTIVGFASSGIIETTVDGFLHVDEDEQYKA